MAKTHLVFIPAWPAGHIASMLQFATKLLQTSNNLTITTLLIKSPSQPCSSTTTSLISSLSSSALDVSFQELPPVDPPTDADSPEDFLSLYLQSHKPHLKHFVSSSSTPVSAIFIDLFATALLDVANELRVPSYVYFTSTALMLALMLHLPTLEEKITEEFEDVEGGIPLPGVEAIPGNSMPSPFMKKESKRYTWFVYHGRRYREAKGIVVNTFEELESQVLRLLGEGLFMPDCSTPKVFPVGPVLTTGEGDEGGLSKHECVRWLDQQPPGSVVFLCFGSMGCFDAAQVKEIAQGLERCGHKFLWILRSPPTSEIRQLTDSNPSELLPTGFLDRTKEQGLVWPSWAPQTQILAHKSIRGFVTHCGWNSCLESLWFGVPMLAWPLYAEQHFNELEMVRDLGVAVGMKFDRKNGNFVKAEELERGVRSLMGESEDGKRVRRKVEEMKVASRKAVDDGGSSCVYMKKLVEELVGGD